MRKTILIGIALLSILFLAGCSDRPDEGVFCQEKGYSNWGYVHPLTGDYAWVCYSIKDNQVTGFSEQIYSIEKPSECRVYNKGDGCAE